MVHAPKLGMRVKANRQGFAFGSERVIQHSFEEDLFPEIMEQQDVMIDNNTDNIERQVFNQQSFDEDRFMMPFQMMNEKERFEQQRNIDSRVPNSEIQKRIRDINNKIW